MFLKKEVRECLSRKCPRHLNIYTHNIKPASPMLIADNLSLQRAAQKWYWMVT